MPKNETPYIPPKNQEIPEDPFDHYFQEHPEAVTPKQLNNFLFNLPGGLYRVDNALNMDKIQKSKVTDSFKKERITDKQIAEIIQTDFSEKGLNQTIREFYKTIDKAVMECSDNLLKKIELMNKKRDALVSQRKTTMAMKLTEEIDALALPVYKKLREWGYNHEELIR